jgi:hypothetical protein
LARERWFYAQGAQRFGPVVFDRLVESVMGEAEPRAVLVWRKGFQGWARAEDVPEVEQRLVTALARKATEEAARRPPPAAPAARRRTEAGKPGSPVLVYGGIGAGVAVLALLAGLFWPRAAPHTPAPTAMPLGGSSPDDAPAVVIPAPPRETPGARATPPTPSTATPAPRSASVIADRESDLPAAELRRMRGVAAWSGETLKLTVYNGTQWRVTELRVRISRFQDDDFVEDSTPVLLLPPSQSVDAGVADLLSRVAPDRKRPGLNPADTGPFEGKAGPQPENFRWEIESARGYAPR